jgi:hypothetical protein
MPLTSKGEKIKGAMEEKYGAEKGEEVFYASKNKGTISGVDSRSPQVSEEVLRQAVGINFLRRRDTMSDQEKMDAIIKKTDNLIGRFDAFNARRRLKNDAIRKKMADARIAKDQKILDAFEEAAHPRNANGIFTVGEGETGKEDTQTDPGLLSKRNIETS